MVFCIATRVRKIFVVVSAVCDISSMRFFFFFNNRVDILSFKYISLIAKVAEVVRKTTNME